MFFWRLSEWSAATSFIYQNLGNIYQIASKTRSVLTLFVLCLNKIIIINEFVCTAINFGCVLSTWTKIKKCFDWIIFLLFSFVLIRVKRVTRWKVFGFSQKGYKFIEKSCHPFKGFCRSQQRSAVILWWSMKIWI